MVLIIAAIISILRFKKVSKPIKVLSILLCTTLINELLSLYLTFKYKNNSFSFHFFNVIELYLITMYFLCLLQPKKIKIYILFISFFYPLFEYLNIIYLQPLSTLNSNFITFETFLTIGLSLYSLYRLLLKDLVNPILKYSHFWFCSIILMYFSCSFCLWPLIKMLYNQKSSYYRIAINIHVVINIFTYLGLGLTFLFSPKMLSDAA